MFGFQKYSCSIIDGEFIIKRHRFELVGIIHKTIQMLDGNMAESPAHSLKVFLSYASEDLFSAEQLYHRLSSDGVNVWFDKKKLLPGQHWKVEIEKAVEKADIFLVCVSNKSVNKEGYVQKELNYALEIALEKPQDTIYIIPVRLDDCVVPRSLRELQRVDYFPPKQRKAAYESLMQSLHIRARKLGLVVDKNEPQILPPPKEPVFKFKDFFAKLSLYAQKSIRLWPVLVIILAAIGSIYLFNMSANQKKIIFSVGTNTITYWSPERLYVRQSIWNQVDTSYYVCKYDISSGSYLIALSPSNCGDEKPLGWINKALVKESFWNLLPYIQF